MTMIMTMMIITMMIMMMMMIMTMMMTMMTTTKKSSPGTVCGVRDKCVRRVYVWCRGQLKGGEGRGREGHEILSVQFSPSSFYEYWLRHNAHTRDAHIFASTHTVKTQCTPICTSLLTYPLCDLVFNAVICRRQTWVYLLVINHLPQQKFYPLFLQDSVYLIGWSWCSLLAIQ